MLPVLCMWNIGNRRVGPAAYFTCLITWSTHFFTLFISFLPCLLLKPQLCFLSLRAVTILHSRFGVYVPLCCFHQEGGKTQTAPAECDYPADHQQHELAETPFFRPRDFFFLLRENLREQFSSPPHMPIHTCPPHTHSHTPELIRAEVEELKSDFNRRIKEVLFNSLFSAYYVAFLPLCFVKVSCRFSFLLVPTSYSARENPNNHYRRKINGVCRNTNKAHKCTLISDIRMMLGILKHVIRHTAGLTWVNLSLNPCFLSIEHSVLWYALVMWASDHGVDQCICDADEPAAATQLLRPASSLCRSPWPLAETRARLIQQRPSAFVSGTSPCTHRNKQKILYSIYNLWG